ncbi:hypothetical protein PAXINDRAFT_18431 [Paxillus involutus ATCC 200175]|uniref:Uncharacterized protein n=1 Tax=Paxillus involutus ATCC 200175 TaxID=664439 RepID=A0A0C9SNU3_PAXIN|nr:hypothetical protein PAXINDRAFT_18431 [Paxillus involutus ATCC 200175]
MPHQPGAREDHRTCRKDVMRHTKPQSTQQALRCPRTSRPPVPYPGADSAIAPTAAMSRPGLLRFSTCNIDRVLRRGLDFGSGWLKLEVHALAWTL